MRFDPRGRFYLRRVMQDDLTDKIEPRTVLDPTLMAYRVTEALAVAVQLARAAGWAEDDVAGFAFRWTGLARRTLNTWADFFSAIYAYGRSVEQSATSYVEIPIATPPNAMPSRVGEAIAPLLAQFEGFELGQDQIETLARKVVERTMRG